MKRLILILLTFILIFSGCANIKPVSVNNIKGKININDVDKIKNLYNELNYKEENYIGGVYWGK